MPYAGEYESREQLRQWLKDNGLSYTQVAERCGVTRQAISQYVCGTLHTLVIRNELRQMGCPEDYLRRRPRYRAEQREVKPIRRHAGYWNPWETGEIRGPYGVPSNSILMCPM
jgi:transcriptional regulator with XRE-family HTH domain